MLCTRAYILRDDICLFSGQLEDCRDHGQEARVLRWLRSSEAADDAVLEVLKIDRRVST